MSEARSRFTVSPETPCFCSCHRQDETCFDCQQGRHVPGVNPACLDPLRAEICRLRIALAQIANSPAKPPEQIARDALWETT